MLHVAEGHGDAVEQVLRRIDDAVLILGLPAEVDFDAREGDQRGQRRRSRDDDLKVHRLLHEARVGLGYLLDGAFVGEIHDVHEASHGAAAPGLARAFENGALVVLLGERLQMLVHGSREVGVRLFLGLGALGLGDLEKELRGLAVDHQERVAGQEDDRVGAQPPALGLARDRVLPDEVAVRHEPERLERVFEADFREVSGTAGGREGAPNRVGHLLAVGHLVVERSHRLDDALKLLCQPLRGLPDVLLGSLLRVLGLALMIVEQLARHLAERLEQRRLRLVEIGLGPRADAAQPRDHGQEDDDSDEGEE